MKKKTILFHKTRKNESEIFYGVLTTKQKTMADEREEWLGAMVSSSVKGAVRITVPLVTVISIMKLFPLATGRKFH